MLWGKQTELAIQNFGSKQVPFKFIVSYAEVKKAAILAIQQIEKFYDDKVFNCIIEAIDEIIEGKHNEQFKIPLTQGGAGTSMNMNINEVIANRATQILKDKYNIDYNIHPLDDINRYQSTNDTFPTAMTILLYRDLVQIEKLNIELQEKLVEKEKSYNHLLIMGRTELADALPMSLSQVFSSWAGMFERDRWRLNKLKERIRTVALGGTAIGTGFPAPSSYLFSVENYLRQVTKLPLCRSQNLVDSIAHHDDYSELASGYLILSKNLIKLSNDFLIYTSSICGEMSHPELQYGSTIMAMKVNPVLLEYVKGNCIKVTHLARMIEDYNEQGNLQLNAFLPFMLDAFIEINELLTNSLNAMIKFVSNVIINDKVINSHLNHSKAIFNLLLPFFGYSKSKEIINQMPHFQDFSEILNWLKNKGISEEILNNLEPKNITRFLKNNIKGNKK